jgi:hypothetical protein
VVIDKAAQVAGGTTVDHVHLFTDTSRASQIEQVRVVSVCGD